jgi:hypothetical protein
MTSRELLDIVADYIEARAAERDRSAFPDSTPVHDLDAIATRWESALDEYVRRP